MSVSRVLFITPQPFFLERGSPYRVRAEVQAIVSHGIEVDLLSYPFGKDIQMPGVRHFRSAGCVGIRSVPIGLSFQKLILDVFLFIKTVHLLLVNRYDAIHGVEEAGVIAAVLTRIFRVPFVFDMHSHMTEQLSQQVIRLDGMIYKFISIVERWSMRRASGIITVSDIITARARRIAPHVPAMTLEDLALGSGREPSSHEVMKLQAEFASHSHHILLYTGNFEPYQGIDLLLEGFAKVISESHRQVSSSGKGFKLVLVGGGNPTDVKFSYYVKKVAELGISHAVVFAGQKTEDEMDAFMCVADVLLSPRIAGAHTPLKIYTYMAAQKPIVATRIAAHTNVLHNENAFLSEPTPEAYAAMVFAAVDSSETASAQRVEKIERAYSLLRRRFSQEEFGRRMGVLYRATLGEYLSEEVLLSPENLELRQRQQGCS